MCRAGSLFVLAICALILVLGVPTAKADLTKQDSSAFTYKYEMDDDPGTTADWTANGGGTHGVSGGILTVDSTNSNMYYMNTGTWAGLFNDTDGWTLEARVKVLSQAPGVHGALGFNQGTATTDEPEFGIATDAVVWNQLGTFSQLGPTADNTNGFHVYRIAQLAGTTTFNVWRDGVLLNAAPLTTNNGIDERLYFPDGGGNWGGSEQIDYLRYTAGAFAPVPEPGGLVLAGSALLALLAYALRKRK